MRKLLLVIMVAILYVSSTELGARQKATAFCDAVHVGDTTWKLRERGLEAGALESSRWVEADDGSRRLVVAFTGMAPGSDYSCVVTERSGLVSAKSLGARSLVTRRSRD